MFSALSGDVPLVGRSVLIEGIGQAVREDDVYGALVYGETGTGKSAIARHLVTSLRGDFIPFLVTPASALATISYGALAPFLIDASADDMASSLGVLRRIMAFFRSRAADRRVLVLLDDAHLLDDDSCHLLAQLVTSRTISLVAFARPVTPVSDELASLCRDGLLERFDMSPLASNEAYDLCCQVLGSTIVRGASDRLRDEASGNPLFLKAILDEALARGSLARPDGVWTLDDEEVALPSSLVDLVRSVTLGLDEHGRKAFDLVALAGVVAFSDLVRLTSEAAVTALLDEGLIRSVQQTPAHAVHAYSLYGKIGRSLVPIGRSSILHAEMRSVVGPDTDLSATAAIRDVEWSLDCGEPVADERLLKAAELALTALDPQAALRYAGAVRAVHLLDPARILRATAFLALGRMEECRIAADGYPQATAMPEEVTAAGLLKVRLIVADGQETAAADEVIEWWSRRIRSWRQDRREPEEFIAPPRRSQDMPGSGPKAVCGPLTPSDDAIRDCEHHLVVARAFSYNALGQYERTVDVLRPFLAAEDAGLRPTVLAGAILAEALGALGRSVEGQKHGAAALTAAERHQQDAPDLHRTAFFRHVHLLVHSGDLRAAERALATYAAGEHRDYSFVGGGFAVLGAVLEARRGSFRAALVQLRPALASLRLSDQESLLPYALGVAAWTAAALGETGLANQCSREFAAVGIHGNRQNALLGHAFEAASRSLLHQDAGASRLVELAAIARRNGWASAEKDILELATVLGDEAAPVLLKDTTSSLEGAEAEILHGYASAVVTRDASALVAAGDGAELREKYLVATDACRRAMDLYARRGDTRSQRALATVLRRRRSRIDGGPADGSYDADGVTPLTARERELVLLAVEGLSNREIARRLTVSVRTVEGHLYRIFVKLGISRREELTADHGEVVRTSWETSRE